MPAASWIQLGGPDLRRKARPHTFLWPNSIRLKKTAHAAERNRPDVKKRREASRRVQSWIDLDRLLFLDGETQAPWVQAKRRTGFTTKTTRLYDCCPIGKRLISPAPRGRWKTPTFIAALQVGRIDVPKVIDGPMHGAAFLAYVEQVPATSW